ncbi:hypothetical protein DY000_02016432 [Brassica cretica]|uniref:Ig-like domain-containing protein n=1 Tax=Brassica cretica TaxID=69181 RepID=A0ABQ7DAA9_BRACR|nr:hypothetical protein DY000_02016432 [Brassica cretica]
MNLFMTKKLTWSSMRKGGAAVTNLFICVYLVLVLLCENLVVVLVVVCRSLLPQMPPASPIEDRGTAILIEDRDRAILECLRLCGVIVKGLPVSLMWRKNDFVGP